jgi:hypothetical protein
MIGSMRWAIAVALAAALLACSSVSASSTSRALVVCPAPYRSFIKSLTVLEGTLQVGVTYTQYEKLLTKVRISYNQLPVSTASGSCLANVGVPGEHAMNSYIAASNSWSACINRIYAGHLISCTATGSPGEGSRQVYWQRASAAIDRAVNSLG